MSFNLDDMTRKFLLAEEKSKDTIETYIYSVMEALDNLSPRTKSDYHRLEVAKKHIREVRRSARRLNERIYKLEEQVKVLEEGRD